VFLTASLAQSHWQKAYDQGAPVVLRSQHFAAGAAVPASGGDAGEHDSEPLDQPPSGHHAPSLAEIMAEQAREEEQQEAAQSGHPRPSSPAGTSSGSYLRVSKAAPASPTDSSVVGGSSVFSMEPRVAGHATAPAAPQPVVAEAEEPGAGLDEVDTSDSKDASADSASASASDDAETISEEAPVARSKSWAEIAAARSRAASDSASDGSDEPSI